MTRDLFSADVRSKARRYAEDGNVAADPDDPTVWWVQGSRAARYRVALFFADEARQHLTGAQCGCRFGGTRVGGITGCSHVAAALLVLRDGRRTARAALVADREERARALEQRAFEVTEAGG